MAGQRARFITLAASAALTVASCNRPQPAPAPATASLAPTPASSPRPASTSSPGLSPPPAAPPPPAPASPSDPATSRSSRPAALATSGSAAGAASNTPAPSPPNPSPLAPPSHAYTVAAIGDSLTDPRSSGGGYLDALARRCPRSRFDNFGKGGDMVNQMRRRFSRELLSPSSPAYSHVIVFGGVNDLYSDLTAGRVPELIARDLSEMYALARAARARVVAITVTPWGGFKRYFNPARQRATLTLNAWIRAQAASGAVDHGLDAYPLLSCGEPERLCPELAAPFRDGLHFGAAGHERLGRALFEQVFSECQ